MDEARWQLVAIRARLGVALSEAALVGAALERWPRSSSGPRAGIARLSAALEQARRDADAVLADVEAAR